MNGQFNFFSLNKPADWARGLAENLEFGERGIFLRKTERYGIYRVINPGQINLPAEICDFTVGKYGLLYFLDEYGNLWNYDYDNDNKNLLFAAGHGMFSHHALMAAGDSTIFLADRAGEARVWAFALTNGQLLWRLDNLSESANYGWFPLDICAGPNGHIFVLAALRRTDTSDWELELEYAEPLGVIKIDESGNIAGIYRNLNFAGWGGSEDGVPGPSVSIAATPDNGFCILIGPARVPGPGRVQEAAAQEREYEARPAMFIYDQDGERINYWRLQSPLHPSGLCMDRDHYIYIGDGRQLEPEAEDDRYVHRFLPSGKFAGYLEGFQGKSGKLLRDARNRLYIWDWQAKSLHIMAMKNVVEKDQIGGATRGVYLSAALDSTVMELQWHRITMEAEIPEDTQIQLSYLASDRKELIIDGHYVNLDDFIKNEQIGMEEKLRALEPYWSKPLVNPRDALLQAQGRFLWLKIEFNGSEWRTPLLSKLRAYFPRSSYLDYLPAVYQDDKESRDFLERFLSLFSTFLLDMEEEIYDIAQLFDARVVSGPFLKWLAGWLDIAVDESWEEETLRQLIIKAPELYRKRGTRQGIEEILAIYAGERPFIVEHFQYKYLQEDIAVKDLMTRLYGQDPYCFHVLLKHEQVPNAARHEGIQKILDEEKPAFTEARLVVLQPWIYMDMHTYLGINTYLSELSLLRLDQKSSIPYSSLLIDVDRNNRFDIHSRVELDAQIK